MGKRRSKSSTAGMLEREECSKTSSSDFITFSKRRDMKNPRVQGGTLPVEVRFEGATSNLLKRTKKVHEEHQCGIGCCHPPCLQPCASTWGFVTLFSLVSLIQGCSYTYLVSVITTVERRFGLRSRTSGLILMGYEFSIVLLGLLINYFGGKGHRPRWIGVGMLCSTASYLLIASPHWIFGSGSDPWDSSSAFHSSQELCQASRVTDVGECPDGAMGREAKITGSLLFVALFLGGIGGAVYYSLGFSYLDDQVKASHSSMLIGMTTGVRLLGPFGGFLLGYFCLSIYIDPGTDPGIDQDNPKWIGAWWLGFVIIAAPLFVTALAFMCLPKELPTSHNLRRRGKEAAEDQVDAQTKNKSTSCLSDFRKTICRLFRNRLYICHVIADIADVAGGLGFFIFLPKYYQNQFRQNPANSSIITGLTGVLVQALGSTIGGCIIKRFKPGSRWVAFWTLSVSTIQLGGVVWLATISCPSIRLHGTNAPSGLWNVSASCNINCGCRMENLEPVCSEDGKMHFFNPCFAGCREEVEDGEDKGGKKYKEYRQCSCIWAPPRKKGGEGMSERRNTSEEISRLRETRDSSSWTESDLDRKPLPYNESENYDKTRQTDMTVSQKTSPRASLWRSAIDGYCPESECDGKLVWYMTSLGVIMFLVASGRVAGMLLRLRTVQPKDKSMAMAFALLCFSAFGYLPGPVIFGTIIDSTCLIWKESDCGERGHCTFYDSDRFRYFLHGTFFCFCAFSVFFDFLVWLCAKGVDMYPEEDKEATEVELQNLKHVPDGV